LIVTAHPLTILVTGSSSGFGRVISQELAARGHHVLATMRDVEGRNRAAAGELEELARDRGTTLEVIELDVEDDASVDRAVAKAVAGGEGIDVLVNNAGGGYLGILEAFSVEQAQELFERNVFSVLRLNRAVLPHMRARGSGLLVHMSSGLARFVLPFNGLYSATKFALEAIAETLRYELATVGIDSVIVEPGVYATGFFEKATTAGPGDRHRIAEYAELTRLAREMGSRRPAAGDPREVAEAVAKLIELPAGSRPVRTTVGWGAQRADGLNAVSEELQQNVLDGLGVREQLSLAGQRATTTEV
jgi:NAD(P)-dependent dehydrogenase (short-subunit alcohol dehydrogenase family)